MARPVKCDFLLTSVVEHERAAAECADPVMREVWLATAAEWRQVSEKRSRARPRRTPKPGTARARAGVWGDFLVLAQQAGADAILDFRQGSQIELVDGLALVAWPNAPEPAPTAEHADVEATAIAGLLNTNANDLIV